MTPEYPTQRLSHFCATAILSSLFLLLCACSSQTVKTTNYTPVIQETAALPESHLLDVAVHMFDPGLDHVADQEDLAVFPEIRKAEARYIPAHIVQALERSAAWGAVRIAPNLSNESDVKVTGKIIQSDGELLMIQVNVEDASGRQWFNKQYRQQASRYAYDPRQKITADPFQNIYNQLANDMLQYRRQLSTVELKSIRSIAELRFAQSFSNDVFSQHLAQDRNGRYAIKRLPADNDPMIERIRRIRERDYLFVDTLQEYHDTFIGDMKKPYQQWRSQSFQEVMAMRGLQREARNRKILGIAAIVAGIAAAGSSDGAARTAGQVAVAGGGYMVKSGFDKSAESQIHIEALLELGDSMEAQIEPQVIELEDRTITLTGTVEDQYNQWRQLLHEIYQLDSGLPTQ